MAPGFWAESYPESPGFKREGTSRAAAASMKPHADILRARCKTALHFGGPMTADECAAVIGEDILSVRPRFSEMAAESPDHAPEIVDTGERRRNTSRRKAIVWRLASPA